MNLFNYVEKFGDIPITEKELTEVDYAIFSQFCYIDYSNIENGLTLEQVGKKLKEINYPNKIGFLLPNTIVPLIYEISNKERYKNLVLSDYIKNIDKNLVEQFCCITITIRDDLKCIVFDGTDDSIVGWKENLNMILKTIPSQERAMQYLNQQSKGYKGKIVITGHSKGGNLAFYSALHSNRYTKEKIERVYSFDGPGLSLKDCKKMVNSKYYDKFVSYITDCSIVGKLFNNQSNVIICKSTNNGIMQHDCFSWSIIDDKFEKIEDNSEESKSIEKTINDILNNMTEEERKKFVDALFKIISCAAVDNLLDIKIQQKLAVISGYFKIEKEDRKLINSVALKMLKDKNLRKIFAMFLIDISKKRFE